MKKWIQHNRGRRWDFVVIFSLFLLISFLSLEFLSKMFFLTGLLWPYALAEKSVEERVHTRRYKYSFLKVAFKLEAFFYFLLDKRSEKHQKRLNGLARGISPLLFCFVLSVIATSGNPLLAICGHLLFEFLLR